MNTISGYFESAGMKIYAVPKASNESIVNIRFTINSPENVLESLSGLFFAEAISRTPTNIMPMVDSIMK